MSIQKKGGRWCARRRTTSSARWKKGFKSGSFSTATPVVPGTDNAFGDEKANGGEVGIKGRVLQGRMQFDTTGFYYNFTGLQVGVIPPPSGGVPVIQTINAATARTYGVDFDVAYLPRFMTGLTLHASVEWDKARYLKFTNAPCWGGQTIAEGCSQEFNPAVAALIVGPTGQSVPTVGAYTAQNLSGTPLIRAPDWDATVGFNLWEVPAIGRDLNDVLTSGQCDSAPFKTGATVPNPSGFAGRSTLGIDPSSCFVDPGREVWLQVTVRPLAGR